MILVDANVFMYAAGAAHPHKEPSLQFLTQVAEGEVEAYVDAETLQEILHRYRAIGRWKEGKTVFDRARHIVPTVTPITAEVLDRARELLDEYPDFLARDALHAAVYEVTGATGLCSYDRDFDRIRGIRRLEPAEIAMG